MAKSLERRVNVVLHREIPGVEKLFYVNGAINFYRSGGNFEIADICSGAYMYEGVCTIATNVQGHCSCPYLSPVKEVCLDNSVVRLCRFSPDITNQEKSFDQNKIWN